MHVYVCVYNGILSTHKEEIVPYVTMGISPGHTMISEIN